MVKVVCLFLVLFLLVASGRAQESLCSAFLNTTGWTGQFSLSAAGMEVKATNRATVEITVQATAVDYLSFPPFFIPNLPIVVGGSAVWSGHVKDEVIDTRDGKLVRLYEGDYGSPAGSLNPVLIYLDDNCRKYRIGANLIGPVPLSAPGEPTHPEAYPFFPSGSLITGDWINVELVGNKPVLRGTATFAAATLTDIKATWSTTWLFAPAGVDEAELIITSDEYVDWSPEGYIDDPAAGFSSSTAAAARPVNIRPAQDAAVRREGNHLDFVVTLQKKGGGTTSLTINKLSLDLKDVTSEPGVTMNYPIDMASDTDNDLGFLPGANPGFVVGDLHAEALGVNAQSSRFRVSAFDFGACGTLQVSATLSDGSEVKGHLLTSPNTAIPVPRHRAGSCISDSYREKYNVTVNDGDDSEMNPIGDGHPGDGYTAYEEYRGWIENGKRVRGDPAVKDILVYIENSRAILLPGVDFYQLLTGLSVHRDFKKNEFPKDRVMNRNYRGQPHAVDQHGVCMVSSGVAMPSTIGNHTLGDADPCVPVKGVTDNFFWPEPRWTPRQVDRIEFPSRIAPPRKNPELLAYQLKAVAHELLHATGVTHHGPFSPVLKWVLYFPGNSKCDLGKCPGIWWDSHGWIDYLDEHTLKPVHLPDLFKISRLNPTEIPFSPSFGGLGSTFSGNQNCVMANEDANSYQNHKTLSTFYYFEYETPVYQLCNSRVGTIGNDKSHEPVPRFGDADAAGGDCVHKICVNDKYHH